ncbi:MAG: hypothetical protein IJE07_14310 [Clostridia bacterium]|nr:hypothetical protein [Clostridia bacterium]
MTCEIRLNRVLGLPAILGEKRVGHVERVGLNPQARQLQGVVIRHGLGGAKWAPRQSVAVLGDVSLVLREAPGRLPPEEPAPPRRVTDGSGLTLGRVTDAWICPDTMEITALEVTLGLCEDLLRGRLRLREWAVQPGPDGELQILMGRNGWEV